MTTIAEAYLAALETERRGYVARGLTDRVAQVDAEIARITGTPAKTRRPRKRAT